jgi:ubiquinone/menaquinone biosynthesis C-methylase UbiE
MRTRERPRYGYYFLRSQLVILSLFEAIGIALILAARTIHFGSLTWFGLGIMGYGLITTLLWFLARFVIPGNRIDLARSVLKDLSPPTDGRILDIGCGLGLYAIEAAKLVPTGEVVAVDVWDPRELPALSFFHSLSRSLSRPSGHSRERAKRNATIEEVENQIHFLNMDAGHLNFPERSFDAITCAFVLGHLGHYARKVLAEVNRVLKDDGQVAIVDNVRDFTYFLLSTPHLFVLSYLRNSKARRLTIEYWISLVEQSGFKATRIRKLRSIIWIRLIKPEKPAIS